MRRRELLAASLGLGAGIITACAPSAAPSAGPAAKVEGYLIPGTGTPKRGGTINLALLPPGPVHWDPSTGGASNGAGGWQSPYEYLFKRRASYFGDTTIEPGLVESWDVSKDGLTYTFKIRKGVKWQNLPPVNGREFVADDVAWTYRHYATYSTQKARFAIADRISAPDKYTVVFTLKQPYTPFMVATLGSGATSFLMLPHEIFEKNGNFNDNPVGTGPWMLDRWERGTRLALKANPDYWDMGADGKPLPYAAGLTWFQYGDLAAAAAAIRAGQIDYYTPGLGGLDLRTATAIKKERPEFVYWDGPLANFHGLTFNHRKKPWNDVRVRKAIALGLDADELIGAAVGGDSVRTGFIPTPITDLAWPVDKVKQKLALDRKTAIQQLKDLGIAGTSVVLSVYSTGDEATNIAQVLASQLGDLGLKIDLKLPASIPAMQALLQSQPEGWELMMMTFQTSFEADDWLTRYWGTSGSLNWWAYKNPEFDRVADAQSRELDPVKRKALIEQAQDILYADMAGVPLLCRINLHHVINPRLRNLRTPHYLPNSFASVWIDG